MKPFQFMQLVLNSQSAKPFLDSEVTIFAPSTAAMAAYNGTKDDNFILNQMSNSNRKEK